MRDMAKHLEVTNQNRRDRKARRMQEATKLLGGSCVVCGSVENIQFDHVDPATKLWNISDGAWKASEKAFWAEVAKCQLLCKPCHKAKTKAEGWLGAKGEKQLSAKLRELDVKYIRELYRLGHSKAAIAEELNVATPTVHKILTGQTWKHVA